VTCGVSQHRDEKFPLTGETYLIIRSCASPQKRQPESGKVDTARHPACIPHYRMIPRLLSLINQHRHLASSDREPPVGHRRGPLIGN